MELFHEMYGCYYAVMRQILREAEKGGITQAGMNALVQQQAFGESGLHLLPRLLDGDWHLLEKKEERYFSTLQNPGVQAPLTHLQKSWLKALLQDPRMCLFLDEEAWAVCQDLLQDVMPLWESVDFYAFDRALDGDPYQDTGYQERFATLLAAIRETRPLRIEYVKAKGGTLWMDFAPTLLQYSAKDDKFRVMGRILHAGGKHKPGLFNMGRIASISSSPLAPPSWLKPGDIPKRSLRTNQVDLYIWPERNGLERCMTQFAFYEKETRGDEKGTGYFCSIRYPQEEETELLIRILSFGPVVKVLGPEPFLQQVRDRMGKQRQLMAK